MKIFNFPFIAGLAFGGFLLFTQWLSTKTGSYLNIGKIGSTSFFTLFPCAVVLLYYQHLHGQEVGRASLIALLRSGIHFILGAALIFGFSHIFNATYIDPQWGEKALASAKENWAAKGYSEEAIASQVEHSDIFQSPFKWGLVLFVFYTLTYGIIHLLLAPISFWFWKRWQLNKQKYYSRIHLYHQFDFYGNIPR